MEAKKQKLQKDIAAAVKGIVDKFKQENGVGPYAVQIRMARIYDDGPPGLYWHVEGATVYIDRGCPKNASTL